jgi:SfnB family sulfur acquisition oxidoreductase
MVLASARCLRTHSEALEAARAFTASIEPGAGERDRSGAVPVKELAEFDRSGLAAMTVPTTFGGGGLGPVTLSEVTRIIAAADPALAQLPQAHYMAVDVLRLAGTERQQSALFPAVVDGGRIGPVLAERGGQHAQDLKTRLVNDDGRLYLQGTKYYCTGAITSHWVAASALDGDGSLVLAFVDRHTPGVHIDEDWTAMGQRATVSGTTTLDRVPVDAGLVIEFGKVFETPQLIGARAQLVHAAIEAGIAEGALADARRFVRTRGRPFFEAVRGGWAQSAADDPHTVLRFGQLRTKVTAAVQLLRWAADVLEELGLHPADADAAARGSLAVAQAKAFASEVAVDVASQLFALSGASGTDRRFDLDRHWRNARTHSVHDPVDWKYHHIGAYELSDTIPPNHAQL